MSDSQVKPTNAAVEPEYGDRDALDAELGSAIAEILSAEQEAKRIIGKAEESVKAVQLDCAVLERDMREASNRKVAEAREERLKAAIERAEAEREKRVAAARAEGEELLSAKSKAIAKQIDTLYASLGGKA